MDATKENNHLYNKSLQPYANKLRKELTKAEACLWKNALRAGLMKSYKFRRQRPIMNYIVDFICLELKLVIEVDGITHQWEETYEKDKIKETEIIKAGFTLLRFTDDEVLNHINNVINRIEDEISRLCPPPAGELKGVD